jgi:hypothetical protein
MATRHNIIIPQNTTYNLGINVSSSGVPLDLTDYSVRSAIKKNYNDTKIFATMSLINPLNTTGSIDFEISSSITKTLPAGSYYYDILLVTGSEQTRILEGTVSVTPFVTD